MPGILGFLRGWSTPCGRTCTLLHSQRVVIPRRVALPVPPQEKDPPSLHVVMGDPSSQHAAAGYLLRFLPAAGIEPGDCRGQYRGEPAPGGVRSK